MEIILSKQSNMHLKRIQELKGCSEERAVELALGVCWLVYENRETRKRVEAPSNVIISKIRET